MYTVRYRRIGGCNSDIHGWYATKRQAEAAAIKLNSKPFTPFFFWCVKENG